MKNIVTAKYCREVADNYIEDLSNTVKNGDVLNGIYNKINKASNNGKYCKIISIPLTTDKRSIPLIIEILKEEGFKVNIYNKLAYRLYGLLGEVEIKIEW